MKTPASSRWRATPSRLEHGAVEADCILLCTHYPIRNFPGLFFLRMYQERSYVVGLTDVPALDGMYIDADPSGIPSRTAGTCSSSAGRGTSPAASRRVPMSVLPPTPARFIRKAASAAAGRPRTTPLWTACPTSAVCRQDAPCADRHRVRQMGHVPRHGRRACCCADLVLDRITPGESFILLNGVCAPSRSVFSPF